MSTKSKPFYWIVCDFEGCDARCPSFDDEYAAFGDEGEACDVALDSDWKTDYAGRGKDYCPDHAPLCDCDLFEKPELPTTCAEFRSNPMNADFCAICGHVEECH